MAKGKRSAPAASSGPPTTSTASVQADGAGSRDEETLREVLVALQAVADGDFDVRMPARRSGLGGEVARAFNASAQRRAQLNKELVRVATVVGREGRMAERVVSPAGGGWAESAASVNGLIEDLVRPTNEVARVLGAVARGDLTQHMALTIDGRPVKGEFQRIGTLVNTMVDQLSSFAEEVTRVAREVGTEGKLGGQARVKGVSGTWKDLTDNVNQLAGNLTSQVRNIAQVTTAVAQGDLSQKITVDVRGELLELKDTVNTMVDQLGSFAAEVTRVAREVGTEGKLGGQAEVEGVSGTWARLTENVNLLAGNLTTQVRAIAEVSSAVTQGDLTRSINVDAAGELEELKDTINQMIANLRETTKLTTDQDWLKSNLARISAALQGHRDLRAVAQLIISELAPLVEAQQGAIFLAHQDASADVEFRLLASYGFNAGEAGRTRWKQGEGLVGQAVLEKAPIRITEAPAGYIRITSGLGEADPVEIVVMPVLFEDEVLAVIELASLHPFTDICRALLEQLVETLGVVLATILATTRTEELLVESLRLTQELQSQSEELQAQQDELRRSNVELEDQARSLKASEELLQTQQEELQGTNAELEEKAAQLVEQKQSIEVKNTEIELARRALEERAEQLSLSSRYKSEFLANMSHELRTPLNSLLILAKLLGDNADRNLSPKQVEFARSIHAAGADLLDLISDILDLSKVEAGKLDLAPGTVDLAALAVTVDQVFRPLADQKGLRLEVDVEDGLPELVTDQQRLTQVLNNLLSNAVKFTDAGTVSLHVRPASKDMVRSALLRQEVDEVVAFEVRDTGIGIAEEKLGIIFGAFQQADGTTSRRYGGTGLGLSISREIAHLLGGELQVGSVPGEGSAFTLLLPTRFPEAALQPPDRTSATVQAAEAWLPPEPPGGVRTVPQEAAMPAPGGDADDDRATIEDGDRVLLLVAADGELAAGAAAAGRERGFKVVIAERADEGIHLARDLRPDAVVLDAQMPGVDGLAVLEELKRLGETRHIPVHVVSSGGERQTARSAGAVAYLEKPVSADDLGAAMGQLVRFLDAPVRRLLVVEDDELERGSIIELITGGAADIQAVGVGSGEEALAALEEQPFDCMVLDLKLPKTSGFGLLEQVKADSRWRDMPVIVYTGRELSRQEATRLKKYAETVIVKDVRSPERLLDETALFLHRVESGLPREKRRMIEQLHSADAVFAGRRILVVDDDMRNVFALTSAFEGRGMGVLFAENGRECVEVLDQHSDIDLVLMDMMMPEMDGYEAMRAIRQREGLKRLPVIALTAKAMKGDRELTIAAGASDYITKPVDVDQLLSLMRVWLYR